MLLLSATFLVTFAVLGIGELGEFVALKVGLSVAAGVLGIWSGVWVLKSKRHAQALAVCFSLLLLGFEGLLLYEGSFDPVIGSLVIAYALLSAGYFVRGKMRQSSTGVSNIDANKDVFIVPSRRLESPSNPTTSENEKGLQD
jgi:hypothetical protein